MLVFGYGHGFEDYKRYLVSRARCVPAVNPQEPWVTLVVNSLISFNLSHVSVWVRLLMFPFNHVVLIWASFLTSFPFLAVSSKGVRRLSQKLTLKIVAICTPVKKN